MNQHEDDTDVARAAELRLLLDAVHDPLAPGRVIAVVGDPGAGKTHLLSAVAKDRRWSANPATVYQCSRRRQECAIDAVRTMVRRARHRAGEQGNQVSRLRARRPPRELVVLDDVHLADERTLAELREMALGHTPPLADVVISLRGRQTPVELAEAIAVGSAYGHCVRVELGPMTDEQLLAVSASSATRAVRGRSRGNPFHLQALQALHECARLGTDAPAAPFELAVLRETRDLTINERYVLHAAAVLRARFDAELLAEVAEVDLRVATAAVGSLGRRDLVRSDPGGDQLCIRDEVFGTLLHRSIDPCWAVKAHQRAINRLTSRGAGERELGFHLVHSLSRARESELERILAAAAEIIASDVAVAISWLTTVIAEAPATTDVGLRARTALSGALGQVGRLAESRELLFVVHESGRADPRELAEQIAFVSVVETMLGHDVQTVDLLTEQLRAGRPRDPAIWPRLVLAQHIRTSMLGRVGDRERTDTALRLAYEHGDLVTAAGLLGARSLDTVAGGDVLGAVADATAAGRLLDRSPEHTVAASPAALMIVGLADVYLGRYVDARRHLARGVNVVHQRGQTFLLPTLLVLLSESERHLGLLQQACHSADSAIVESGTGNSHRHAQATALKSLAEVWLQPPGSGRAKVLAQQAMAQQPVAESSVNGSAAIAALALARCTWLDGDAAHCVTLVLNEGKGADLLGIPANHRGSFWELLCAAGADAEDPRVPEWAARSRAQALANPLPYNLACAELADGHAARAQGRTSEAAECYERAAGAYAGASMAIEQAYALGHAAAVLEPLGRHAHARDHAALAHEIARRHGALTLADWFESRVQPEGAAEPEVAVLVDLTRREREIALLIRAGMKRKEIADRLDISTRTVDVHLTRIYRKTGVRSQVELALALTQSGG
ncbi:LuxR C-terminal-related transcriptional regulator [Actinokineospora sp. NBRC 105648]|uniref:LuxR C-terminal-related transcriptional regulator n=1 Tax=Actinokineospora sp. NBRC 105648 TaxID=3032206 RepID=UPI0024A5488B|nr:LuxR C-terminal-related transcriptional regulator [Actinokineospora sp. NBRC 105648]GLZ40827.1 transcriptional regulator [Actinokineospora sp. NBRC 105648]